MATSALRIIAEDQREKSANDALYYQDLLYYFELRVPSRLVPGGEGRFLYPLVLNPESYELDEPFTVEATPTQGGGLYAEENGIVRRVIRLSGTTGFKPRRFKGTTRTAVSAYSSERSSYSRKLSSYVFLPLSGQRHFHYLQDTVFRTYADLKRDPSTAEETRMLFHIPKDEESWVVLPQRFNLKRTKDERVLYRYDIELLVVDKADALELGVSEDKGLLDTIKDTVKMVKSGVDMVKGAINDVTALVNDIENIVKGVGNFINDVVSLVEAADDFVNGVTDLIAAPFALCIQAADGIEEAIAFAQNIENSVEDIRSLPDNVVNKFRVVVDGLDRIGSHPEVFETQAASQLLALKKAEELLTAISFERKEEALATPSPTTLAESEALGSAVTAGDIQSAEGELGIGRAINEYTSATVQTITSGDTLISLAARYLGDARLWQHIAAANGLKPPFVSEQATLDLTSERGPFAGAIGVGMEILIPNYSKPPEAMPVLPILGVRPEETAEVHLLGTDVAIEKVGGRPGAPLYDIAVDTEKGSTGPKVINGRDNLAQAMLLRMVIEQGTDVLYRNVGLGRIAGSNMTLLDIASARFKVRESLSQDSRIASVRGINFEEGDADALTFDVELEVRGFTRASNVRIAL